MGVDEAVGSFADAQPFERRVEEGQLIFRQGMGDIAQLVRIDPHVVVSDKAGNEFTIKRVVSRVERPHAPIRVVVGVHADAERSIVPQRSRPPVVLIVAETIHLLVVALAVVRLDHGPFSTQLLLASLLALLFHLATVGLTNQPLLVARLVARPIDVDTRAHPDPPSIVVWPTRNGRKQIKTMHFKRNVFLPFFCSRYKRRSLEVV